MILSLVLLLLSSSVNFHMIYSESFPCWLNNEWQLYWHRPLYCLCFRPLLLLFLFSPERVTVLLLWLSGYLEIDMNPHLYAVSSNTSIFFRLYVFIKFNETKTIPSPTLYPAVQICVVFTNDILHYISAIPRPHTPTRMRETLHTCPCNLFVLSAVILHPTRIETLEFYHLSQPYQLTL